MLQIYIYQSKEIMFSKIFQYSIQSLTCFPRLYLFGYFEFCLTFFKIFFSKETIRIRTCHYVHTKCISCILSEMKKSSNKEDSSATNVENRQIICKVNGCENGAPYRCFDAVICILRETKLMVTLKLFILCVNMQCLHMLFTSFTY